MHTFETSVHIESPPERVFEVITDLAGAEGRIKAIKAVEVLTDGPVGKGTRWRETRTMFGRDATAEMEITEFTPGVGYVAESESCGCTYRCAFTVSPEAGGSRLSARMDAMAESFFARLMGAVMTPFMRKTIIRAFNADLADIKAVAEAGG